MREVRPETDYTFRNGGVQGLKEPEYVKFVIDDFPFPKHQGEITTAQEALIEKHFALLDHSYDDEGEFMRALRTLANAFHLVARGTCYDVNGRNECDVEVSPGVF